MAPSGSSSVTDRTIICVASDWEYDPTSKHQIMKILSRTNRVVWVNYRGTRRPTVSRADVVGMLSTLGRVTEGVRRVSTNMVQTTPLVIPAPRRAVFRKINEYLVTRAIRRAIASLDGAAGKPIQVWTFAPDTAFLAGKFGEERFIYYCVDEHAQFEGFDADYVTNAEREQIDVSDVLITTSAALMESKGERHTNKHLVRHGVDAVHFGRAVDQDLPVPEELKGVSHPVIGFFGVLHHWVDVSLVAKVARIRPEYTFVLIGEVLVDVTELQALPNVRILGRRPYASLPAYCRFFDAAMLPFVRTEMTRSVNPIKMREYLAAGLPVVSTSLPEARVYEPDIVIADGAEEFAAGCDRVLQEAIPGQGLPTPARRRRARTVADDSWEGVVRRLSSIVMGTPAQDATASVEAAGVAAVELPLAASMA